VDPLFLTLILCSTVVLVASCFDRKPRFIVDFDGIHLEAHSAEDMEVLLDAVAEFNRPAPAASE
jgi:hypothetical protein